MATQEEVLSVESIVEAIVTALKSYDDIDVLTLTANGEPTLYPYLLELIERINEIKGESKVLILSNASTINDPKVQEALLLFDEVKLSLDCATQACLKKLDRSHSGIEVEAIKEGMLRFKKSYTNPLIVEILMVKNLNDKAQEIEALNSYLLKLQPTRIDLGTIDRPPAFDVKPLSYAELLEVSHHFDASLPLYIASRKKAEMTPSSYSSEEILRTLQKRPLTQEDIEALFNKESQERFKAMLEADKVLLVETNGVFFYKKA
jgi:wyosine [tRNA(Phe)-imidazoG37] synthetase (radical SAM superfamily)